MKLSEGDLQFQFVGAFSAMNFDDGTTHATSSIQPVDLIVEYEDHYLFVEVKDPDIPDASNVEGFKEKLKSGILIRSLAGKYRDSMFFRGFQGLDSKEIQYVVLLSMEELDDALLVTKQDELHRSIPFNHASWHSTSSAACVILNLYQWKKRYGDNSVHRMSDTAAASGGE